MAARQILTVAEMGRADAAAIAAGTPGPVLMERAGAAVADAVCARFRPQPVVVLCGPGNNGGDGYVIARHLHNRGSDVTVGLVGERDKIKGDAKVHLDACAKSGVLPWAGATEDQARLACAAAGGRLCTAFEWTSGIDTYSRDPLGDFALTTEAYSACGGRVAQALDRLVILQEGGYYLPDLGENVRQWLRGVELT